MKENNSKSLDKLINNIKSQSPLIPIEGIENMSKGFFAAPKVWFQNWMKITIAAVVCIIIIATTVFVLNKKSSNQAKTLKTQSPLLLQDNTNTNTVDTLEAGNFSDNKIEKDAWKGNQDFKDKKIVTNNTPSKYILKSIDSSIINSLSAEKQTFKIDALRDTMILGKYGTKLVFYKACFEDLSGNIAKSNVIITLKECYNYPEMVKENLNTHCESGYLETRGMIWLQVSSKGKELKLREGFDCPIDFAASNVNDYNLYYSNTSKYSTTNWVLDTLGKVPNPVIIANSGRYWDICSNYFIDNYKLSKTSMLGLYGKAWSLHFTSTDTKMFGYSACTSADINLNLACFKFRNLCEDIYKEVPNIKHSSWETRFGFACISRDSLNRWLANDTVQRKVNKALFGAEMRSPFFSSRLGWINCDHSVCGGFLKNSKQIISFTNYPTDAYTKVYLLLKNRMVIANPGGNNENPIFYNLPKNAEATLFSYKIVNGSISYLQMDINTLTDKITLGNFEPLKDIDALISKINELINPEVN